MNHQITHLTMIKRAESGIIQCVIKPCFRKDFEALGFVDHVDKLKAPKKTRGKSIKVASTNANH